MAIELELKLTLNATGMSKALAWFMVQPEASVGRQQQLVNCYYDTQDGALNNQRAALRIRQMGERYVQTLKTQGEFLNGAHRRNEWEWDVKEPVLSLGLLSETPLASGVDLAHLRPIFETNFTRQIIVLDDGEAVIECALDDGVVIAGDREIELHEVEFELKSGNPGRLLVWTRRLAETCPVFLNLISKAEQGYYLAGMWSERKPVPGTEWCHLSEARVVEELLRNLSAAWLTKQPVMIGNEESQLLADHSDACNLSSAATWLIQQLTNGITVDQLLDRRELGQCQVSLLT